MPRGRTFAGLDDADRLVQSAWLSRASTRGIDTSLGLSVRPWGVADAGAVVGVFEAGMRRASWLVVRQGAAWTLGRCSDGFVSDVMGSPSATLAPIDVDPALAGSSF